MQFFLAEAGDIIITRTPAGVVLGKAGMEIPQAADVVWLGIDGLGTKQQTNRARQGRLNSRILRLHVSLARDDPFELSYRKGKCHTSPNLSPQLSFDAGDEAFLLKTRATTDHESWLFHYANPVTNIPAIVTEAIADIGFGLLIAVARNIALGDRLLRTGVYPGPRFQLSRRRTDARSAWLVSVASVKPWRGAAAVST